MSNHDDDHDDNNDNIPNLSAWAEAAGTSDERPAVDAAEAAAQAIVGRLGRERLLALWRTAVGSIGDAVEADRTHDRDAPSAAAAGWAMLAARARTGEAN